MEKTKKFTYTVNARFDMGMSGGSGPYRFEAANDEAAKKHLRRMTGGWLSAIKRSVSFDMNTLARVV